VATRAVVADDALERRGRLHVLRRLGVRAERVVAVERAHGEVVQVDVLAGAMSRLAKPMIWL
jgi:hypothetical protein